MQLSRIYRFFFCFILLWYQILMNSPVSYLNQYLFINNKKQKTKIKILLVYIYGNKSKSRL